jgi:hypothetical protein
MLAAIGATRPVAANPAIYEAGSDPAVGFNLISWWNFGSSGASVWQNAVQQIYNAGFRSVSISPVRFVNISTGQILTTSPKGPELSHIEAGVARAKSLGMRVTLNPFYEFYDPSTNEYFASISGCGSWRACWNPTPGSAASNQFWTDYQSYMVAVGQIGATYSVDAMTVGTEYNRLVENSGHNSSWNTLINAVNNVFPGLLGYAANWDDYAHSNVNAAIWSHPAIDFLGIDSYFTNLVTNSQADASGTFPNAAFINTVTNAWNNKLDNQILPYAAGRKGGAGMPVAFTEIGYLPYNRTTVNPQNSSGQPVDTDEQKMAFNGLINALDGRANHFLAMDIWNWGMGGTGTNLWDMGTIADVSPNNEGANPNNIAATQWLQQFVGTAVYPLAGDFNRDAIVDAADYVLWRKMAGRYVLQYSGADGSGNGIVDQADYNVWRSWFGATPGGGAGSVASVPEPASIVLLIGPLAVVLPFRERKTHPVKRDDRAWTV